uniref:Uncharacterized protein n=1 Tax=Magallana gigas TaxID=29159 RepID=K1PZT0_MAGGI
MAVTDNFEEGEMISMKTNRDMDIYKRQFRSQEFARELNKREQRRLDQEVGGRGGIEAEYRFNLDKVNQERKEIEKELNKIRGGVHKQLGHHATLSSDKKFHHPKFKELGMKDVSSRSPRLQRKAPPENNSRGRDSSPMNAEMLIQTCHLTSQLVRRSPLYKYPETKVERLLRR